MAHLLNDLRGLHRPMKKAVITELVGNLAGSTPAVVVKDFRFPLGRIQSAKIAEAINSLDTSLVASILSGNAQTYVLVDGQTLKVKIDGGAEQTATFNTADFADIGAATAAEVAAVLESDIVGATSIAETNKVKITSDLITGGGSVQVTGGTANTALGFSTTTVEAQKALTAKQLHDPWSKKTIDRLKLVTV